MKFSVTVSLSALALSCALLCGAQAAPVTPEVTPGLTGQEGLNATAWVQSSAEAKIAARQAYHLAARQLDAALRDRNWSAAVEQRAPYQKLPPAILLDLDETVLDNSPYQARLVRDDALFSMNSWEAWVSQASAPAVSGAPAFLKYAALKGVEIFYVSNRDANEEAATRENLRRLGCPIGTDGDHVLLKGERADWTSDKTSRRQWVAQTHRILLLLGDDLNDFVSAKPLTLAARTALLNKYDVYWGERWILLSNPLYGSWEGALFDYQNDLSRAEMLRRKYDSLDFGEPLTALPPVPSVANR